MLRISGGGSNFDKYSAAAINHRAKCLLSKREQEIVEHKKELEELGVPVGSGHMQLAASTMAAPLRAGDLAITEPGLRKQQKFKAHRFPITDM